jgi:cytochrome P450
MISDKPEVLSKLRAEHEEILGRDPSLAYETIAQSPYMLNQLPYTVAVIKETLRLHPIGSSFRRGSADFCFVHNNVAYPTEGAIIHTNLTIVHLRADPWPRATEFLPERFLVPTGHPLRAPPNAWRAFELGHTRCIGEELAMVEMKLALVFTVRDIEFNSNPQQEKVEYAQSLIAPL